MPRRVPPIARVRLARSLPRLLAWPAIVIGTGTLALASWYSGSFGIGIGGIVFAAIGGGLIVAGLVGAAILLSIRLEIEEAAVRLVWIGGERIYPLVRGPVTRVRLRGPDASRLRPRMGFFGWAIGSAQLRDEEEIQVVRLARTRTAILVPTERGRLAIAAADEDRLLDALSHAARARARLEELEDATRPAEPDPSRVEAAMVSAPAAGSGESDSEPRAMTGIERALMEQRLADERAAAEAAAAMPDSEAALEHVDVSDGATLEPAPPAARPRRRLTLRRPRPSAALVLLPLLGAGAAWMTGLASGAYPDPESDAGRITAMALVLAGPATSVGAIMALAWWPRLMGVVVAGGLAASAFIARSLLG